MAPKSCAQGRWAQRYTQARYGLLFRAPRRYGGRRGAKCFGGTLPAMRLRALITCAFALCNPCAFAQFPAGQARDVYRASLTFVSDGRRRKRGPLVPILQRLHPSAG